MSGEPARPRRSRKSIAIQPNTTTKSNEASLSTADAKTARKTRSKSLGPGGLDALNAAEGGKKSALKVGNGNGRRTSLAPTAQVRSILKPTLPPLPDIPAHKAKPEPKKSAIQPSSIFQPPPATYGEPKTIPVRSEEEQQKRAEILAARAARRQSMGNRRVSFAAEATLHTWDVIDYNVGDGSSTPGGSSEASSTPASNRRKRSSISNVPATPTPTPSTPPGQVEREVETPPNARGGHQKKNRRVSVAKTPPMNFDNPDAEFMSSSPISGNEDESGFVSMDEEGSDGSSGSDSLDDDESGDDHTFMSIADTSAGEGDTRMSMGMEMNTTNLPDDTSGLKPYFKKPMAWRFEGETAPIPPATPDAAPQKQPAEEDDEDEMMDFTKPVGGVISTSNVSFPFSPEVVNARKNESPTAGGQAHAEHSSDDEGGDTMAMDMTMPVGGILSAQNAKKKAIGFQQSSDDEDMTMGMDMDMTQAVGGILSAAEVGTPKRPRFVEPESASEDDMTMDMDFTRPVGGILSSGPAAQSVPTHRGSPPKTSSGGNEPSDYMSFGRDNRNQLPEGWDFDEEEPPRQREDWGRQDDWDRRDERDERGERDDRDYRDDRDHRDDRDDRDNRGERDERDEREDRYAEEEREDRYAQEAGSRRRSGGFLISGADWITTQNEMRDQQEKDKSTGEDKKDEDDHEMDMDMTVAVGGILSGASKNANVTKPATPPVEERLQSIDEDDDESMGDVVSYPDLGPKSPIAAFQSEEPEVEEPEAKAPEPELPEPEQTSSSRTTRAKRRSSAAPVATPPSTRRSTRRTGAPQKEIEQKDIEQEKSTTPKSEPPAKKATPAKPETPAAKPKTPTPRKAATPKAKSVTPKTTTPQVVTPKVATPKTPTPKVSYPKLATPEAVISTPENVPTPNNAIPETPTAPAVQPETPTNVAPKTPTMETPVRPIAPLSGFSMSAKKRLKFQTPPARTTPKTQTKGLGIDRPGLGSPAIASKLARRQSLNELPMIFSPVGTPSALIRAAEDDAKEAEREEREQKQREAEQVRKLDLMSKIQIMLTPNKPMRKSLAFGFNLPEKRSLDLEPESARKRRRSGAESLGDGEELTMSGIEFSKAQQLPVPGTGRPKTPGKTPRKTPRKTPGRKVLDSATKSALGSPVRMPSLTEAATPTAAPKGKGVDFTDEKEPVPQDEEDEEVEDDSMDNISLGEFLKMIDISFLDGLVAVKRRNTTFIPEKRSSTSEEEASLADILIAGACTVPILELFQFACRELKKYIKEGHDVIREIEDDTLADNPVLFKDYMYAPADMKGLMDSQFKNVKEHARLLARSVWYDWRNGLTCNVKLGLEGNLEGLRKDEETLTEQMKVLKPVVPELKRKWQETKDRLEKLQDIKRRIDNDDPKELEEARNDLKATKERIEVVRKDLEKKSAELDKMKTKIAIQDQKKAELKASIEEAERIKELNRGWSSEEVRAWKDRCEELKKSSGWSLETVLPDGRLDMLFRHELRLVLDPNQKTAPIVEYTPPENPKPSDPPLIREVERTFFINGLKTKLQNQRDPKRIVKTTADYWKTAREVFSNIESLRARHYTIATIGKGGADLGVQATVMIAELRSKMEVGFVVTRDTLQTKRTAVRVVYGGISEPAIQGVMQDWTGDWKEGVGAVVQLCLDDRRRGGVQVGVKG